MANTRSVSLQRSAARQEIVANESSVLVSKSAVKLHFRHALDKFAEPFLEFDHTDGSNFDPEIAQQPSDIVLDGESFLLQQLAPSTKRAVFGSSASSHAPAGID